MRALALAALSTSLLACAPPSARPAICPPAAAAPSADPSTGPPRRDPASIDTRYCSVHYVAGHRADAEELAQFVTEATERSTAYFHEHPPEALWKGVSCRVHQMEIPSSLARDEASTIVDGGTRDEFSGDVFLLSTSAYRRSVPLRADADPHENRRRIVTHELATIPLVRATLLKGPGWRFHSAPQWFTQGYEEYLAAFTTTEELKRRMTRDALEKIAARRDAIRWEGTVFSDEPYSGGLLLLWFLHERFGEAAVKAILGSHLATFAAAFRETLGVEPAALRDDVDRWMDQKLTGASPPK